jgi:ABC-type Mn2+/Zn2+ transport system ATPase subunit
VDVIVATGIRKHYGPVEAVAGITLAVAAGQIVAVLGPNGAGKTTTIELLLGLRRPSAGQVRVFGQRPDAPQVRGRVGAMLQDANVPESLTVAELVGLVGRYYPYALPVGEVLSKAGLVGRDGVRVGELSGGQRQRLSFALAIVGDPDLLFLDEPTVALDVEARCSWQATWQTTTRPPAAATHAESRPHAAGSAGRHLAGIQRRGEGNGHCVAVRQDAALVARLGARGAQVPTTQRQTNPGRSADGF